MKTKQLTVGVFHRDQLNRKGLMKMLSAEFNCVEIGNWNDVASSKAEVIVLGSPELLYPLVSFEAITEVIEKHESKVIMINHDKRHWWIFAENYYQLRCPTEERLKMKLRELNPYRRKLRGFRRKWLRA